MKKDRKTENKKQQKKTPVSHYEQESVTDYGEMENGSGDLSTCSTTDCTGLIPAGVTDEEMTEHYTQLYPYLPKAD